MNMIKIKTIKTFEINDGTNWIKDPANEDCNIVFSTFDYFNTLLRIENIDKIHHREELPCKVVSISSDNNQRITYTFKFKDSDVENIKKEFGFLEARAPAHLYCQEYFVRKLSETGESSFLGFDNRIDFANRIIFNIERVFSETYGEHYMRKMGGTIKVLIEYLKVGDILINQYIQAYELAKHFGADDNNFFIL